jgi:AGCS family alanine or glycine:cation symporter
MDYLTEINEALSGVVWGAPMLVLLLGTGLYLSVRTGFLQITRFGYMMRNTLGRIFMKQKADDGSVTPFQALTTALAATAGTGNIAGVTTALTIGGPGAIFWMWVSGFIGMMTKYVEIVLAIRYRERNDKGEYVGGPMYYIKNGLGKGVNWLGVLFCLFGSLAALGVGNAVQVGNMTSSIKAALFHFAPGTAQLEDLIGLVIGLVTAVLVGLTLFGGFKRIGRVTEAVVPFAAVLYIVATLAVIFANMGEVGAAFGQIFRLAFAPQAALGGAAGVGAREAIRWGVRRGVFTNEAGLGSAPIAHAGTSEKSPVMQGLYGICEVFIDTIVMCTLTALTLLVSGIALPYGTTGTVDLNIAAFATVLGMDASSLLLCASMTLFALATVLGWALYGMRCFEYIFGTGRLKLYQTVYILVTVLGATTDLEMIWSVGDTLNGLMAVPNLIALLLLSGVAVEITKKHFRHTDLREPKMGKAKGKERPLRLR